MGTVGCKDIKAPRTRTVQLAATPIGPQVPGVPVAYHTSVAVDGLEYSFGPSGLVVCNTFQSHYCLTNGPTEVIDCGTTMWTGQELTEALQSDFGVGTYDILRKNCNDFSACALFYLTGRRLDTKYRAMEQMGKYADEHLGLIRVVTMGDYVPNPKATTFDVEEIIGRMKFARIGYGQQRRMQDSYTVGQPVEVYSATYEMRVGARVQTIHQDGQVIVAYDNHRCRKTVSAADMSRIVRPFRGGSRDQNATVSRTPFPCDGWVRRQRCNSFNSCGAPYRTHIQL